PFLAIFWTAAAFMVGLAIFVPLSLVRRNLGLWLLAVMALMLIIQALAHMPIERRIAHVVAQEIKRHPDQAKILLLTLTTGKTAWFWLVFLALGLAATTETALGAIKRLHQPVAASIPVIFGGLFLLTSFTGIVGLVVLREVGIGGLEAKIN